jgi:hypothetical protein
VHRKTAEFLSSYSERFRGSRVRWLLACRAWRVLEAAAVRGDGNAAEAIWQAWLRRPLAQFRPADLQAVTKLAGRSTDPAVTAALGLLRACLEHRFAADMAIGGVTTGEGAWTGPDDIALA